MPLGKRIRSFFRNILSSTGEDSELDRELEAYVELLTDERMTEGVRRGDVRRQVLAEMGGKERVKEKVRERRIGATVDELLRDCHFAWRLLWRDPAFSCLVIATLTLGTGATTAVFSVVRGVLLRDLPYPSPERLVFVAATARDGRRHFSPPDYVDFTDASRSFEALAAIQGPGYVTLTADGNPQAVRAREVTSQFLSVYGVSPHIGRAFTESDRDTVAFERLDDPTTSLPTGVIMLGYEFWRERFGGDPSVVGRLVELEYQPYQIVGVTPPRFRTLLPDEGDYASRVDVWILTRMHFESMPRDAAFLRVVGRLGGDTDIAQARAEAALFATQQRGRYPSHGEAGFQVEVIGLREAINDRPATTVWVVFGAVLFLMLIACANLVNLFLIRTLSRRREIAVRLALGSGRARIVRQLVTESLLYALFAVGLGFPLAAGLVELFARLAPPSIPRITEIGVDGGVLGFSLAASLAAVLLAALPATRLSSSGENAMLRNAGRNLGGGDRMVWRHAVVVTEVALSVVLVVGTLLFLRTLAGLLAVDPGFRAEGVLTAEMNLPSRRYPRYPRADERVRFVRQLTERLERLPAVSEAALALVVPLGGQDAGHTYASEEMAATRRLPPPAKYRPVTPGYFDVVNTRIVEGRTFSWDEVEQFRLVSVVDEKLAKKAWSGQSPIGKRLRIERWATSGGPIHLEPLWTEVIGVAQDVRSIGLGADDIETVYLPYGLYAVSELSLLVRTSEEPEEMVESVRAEVARVDPDLAVFNYRPMTDFVAATVAPERYSLGLLLAFGTIGFLLTLVGVYGVLAHAVSLRRQEFGLRLALGAGTTEIAGMVLARGARLLALGVTLGLVTALGLAHFLASQLYAVSPTDPASYALVAAFVIGVGLVACALPAYRAARTDPMRTLRLET